MKKPLVFVVMVSYLLLSIGVSVNFHYCMNKLDSTRLFASSSKFCNKCGMHTDKSHGCCRDEVKTVKGEDDQQRTVDMNPGIPDMVAIVQTPSLFISAAFQNQGHEISFRDGSPPPLIQEDTYLQNCVFRI